MPRSLSCVFAIAALSVATPSFAADYNNYPELRPSYPDDWANSEENPLRFEAGVRYWYSIGKQTVDTGSNTFTATDKSHILEGHFRIDDPSTNSFVKGQAAYAVVTTGEYSGSLAPTTEFAGGQIGSAGADFGWTPFGNESARAGFLVGYQFLRESPDRNRLDLASIDGLNIQSLRLGVTGHADLGTMFDVDAEAVAVPYAFGSGATAEVPFANTTMQGLNVNRTNTILTSALYGASGQLMFGFHPTETLTIRIGGRASILTGQGSTTTKYWDVATPNSYLYSNDPLKSLSLVRYGGLLELTGRF